MKNNNRVKNYIKTIACVLVITFFSSCAPGPRIFYSAKGSISVAARLKKDIDKWASVQSFEANAKNDVDSLKAIDKDGFKKIYRSIHDHNHMYYQYNRRINRLKNVASRRGFPQAFGKQLDALQVELNTKAGVQWGVEDTTKVNADCCDCNDCGLDVCHVQAHISHDTANMNKIRVQTPGGKNKSKNSQDSDKLKEAIDSLHIYFNDSIKYQRMIKGIQKPSLSLALFQNFADVGNDDPKSYTAYHLNLNIPINRINGKVSCRNTTWIWFRNMYLEFQNATNKNLGANAKDTLKTLYVNNLDLYQYSSLRACVSFNLFTLVNTPAQSGIFSHDKIFFYFDAFSGLNRTTIYRQSSKTNDSIFSTNSGIYGVKATWITLFPSTQITTIVSARLFWIDPNTSAFVPGLNAQYDKLKYESNATFNIPNSQIYPYASASLTVQYNLGNSGSSNKVPGSSSNASTSPNFLYAFIEYNSNAAIGVGKGLFGVLGPNKRVANNFVSVMLGYSVDIATVIDTIKTLAGIKSNSSSSKKNG